MPSGNFSVGVEMTPNTTALSLRPKLRSTAIAFGVTEAGSRSYSSNVPSGKLGIALLRLFVRVTPSVTASSMLRSSEVNMLMISYG